MSEQAAPASPEKTTPAPEQPTVEKKDGQEITTIPPNPAPAPVDPTPTPAAPQQAAAAAAAPAKLGVFAKAGAMLREKSELLSEIETLRGQLHTVTTERGAFASELAMAKQRIAGYEAGEAELSATIEKLSAEKTSVSEEARNQVAALGFDANRLPGSIDANAAQDGAPTSVADFMAKHAEMVKTDASAASAFYNAHSKKFGL